jgi:hypothetical protein
MENNELHYKDPFMTNNITEKNFNIDENNKDKNNKLETYSVNDW